MPDKSNQIQFEYVPQYAGQNLMIYCKVDELKPVQSLKCREFFKSIKNAWVPITGKRGLGEGDRACVVLKRGLVTPKVASAMGCWVFISGQAS